MKMHLPHVGSDVEFCLYPDAHLEKMQLAIFLHLEFYQAAQANKQESIFIESQHPFFNNYCRTQLHLQNQHR